MGSGPRSGIGELFLPELQKGSSIMPGKVNPVIPEVVLQVAAQVIGNDAAITVAGLQGQFELNVRIPLIARNLLGSIGLLTAAATLFGRKCVDGIEANLEGCERSAEGTLAVATALNPFIGYDKASEIVKDASKSGGPMVSPVRIAPSRVPPGFGDSMAGKPVAFGIDDLFTEGNLTRLGDNFVAGLSNGAIWALVAIGYTLVYGIIELINFAHGEVFMIGSFTSAAFWTTIGLTLTSSPVVIILGLLLTLVVAMIVCGGLNVMIERVAYRPLRSAPKLAPLITAVGMSFILQNVGLLWKGGSHQSVVDLIGSRPPCARRARVNEEIQGDPRGRGDGRRRSHADRMWRLRWGRSGQRFERRRSRRGGGCQG